MQNWRRFSRFAGVLAGLGWDWRQGDGSLGGLVNLSGGCPSRSLGVLRLKVVCSE